MFYIGNITYRLPKFINFLSTRVSYTFHLTDWSRNTFTREQQSHAENMLKPY